jgi:hypothetical protein
MVVSYEMVRWSEFPSGYGTGVQEQDSAIIAY